MDHLGIEVESSEQVRAATARLDGAGLDTTVEHATTCCYAVQDRVRVYGPGAGPWEVYTVLSDASEAISASTLKPATVCARRRGQFGVTAICSCHDHWPPRLLSGRPQHLY